MAAYRRVDDLRSPAGRLPVHRDQLRAQRSVSSMGKPLRPARSPLLALFLSLSVFPSLRWSLGLKLNLFPHFYGSGLFCRTDTVRVLFERHQNTKFAKKYNFFIRHAYVHIRYMLSPVRLSSVVCRLSVGNARAPYSCGSQFRQYFNGIRYLGHPLTSTENFTKIVPEEPLRRGVKHKRDSQV